MSSLLKIPIFNWLFFVGLIIICGGLPPVLTVVNIINLFKKKKIHPAITDTLIFVLGIILTVYLYNMIFYNDDAPIASRSMPTIITIWIIGVISYAIIRIKKLKLPPLLLNFGIAGTLICSIGMLIFIVQISQSILTDSSSLVPFLLLFPLNYILCSIRAKRELIEFHKEQVREKGNSAIANSDNWGIMSVIFAVIIFIVMTEILIAFGQKPDELIKAFTETKGWLLSVK